jgi:hypothetical protein
MIYGGNVGPEVKGFYKLRLNDGTTYQGLD